MRSSPLLVHFVRVHLITSVARLASLNFFEGLRIESIFLLLGLRFGRCQVCSSQKG